MDGINRHATTSQPSFGSNTRTTRFRLNLPTSLIRQTKPLSNLIPTSTKKNWRKIVRSESFASEVKSDSWEIAANAVERSPEIGGFAVGIVENYGCGIELLRKASGAPETQTLSLRTSRDPCKCKVGNKVIVVV